MGTQVYPSQSTTALPTGAATAALQTSGNSSLTSIDGKLPAGGLSTAALQTSGNASLTSIDGKTPALGQAAMASSIPVVIANNQSAVPVKLQDGTGTALTSQANGSARALDVGVNVAGVQVDPRSIRALTASDVVTAKLQDGSGSAVNKGQADMAGSLPVVFANNQSSLPVTPATLTVVDQIDTTPLLDLSSTNIPASSANSVSVVASTAAIVKKIVTVEDIGEFIGLYTGAVATPTLLCILPLGGGEMDVTIPAGTLVSLRHMKNSAIASGYIAINFLG